MSFARRRKDGSIGMKESQRTSHGCVGLPSRCHHRSVCGVRCPQACGSARLLRGGENSQVALGGRPGRHETHCWGIRPAMKSPAPTTTSPQGGKCCTLVSLAEIGGVRSARGGP